jgi:hypothetical protein
MESVHNSSRLPIDNDRRQLRPHPNRIRQSANMSVVDRLPRMHGALKNKIPHRDIY